MTGTSTCAMATVGRPVGPGNTVVYSNKPIRTTVPRIVGISDAKARPRTIINESLKFIEVGVYVYVTTTVSGKSVLS